MKMGVVKQPCNFIHKFDLFAQFHGSFLSIVYDLYISITSHMLYCVAINDEAGHFVSYLTTL
jgi:hypothetical protein